MSNRYTIATGAVKQALDEEHVKLVNCAIVGSSYITGRQDGDVDVLVLGDTDPNEVGFAGWKYGGSVGEGQDQWGSWKRTVDGVEVNLLLTKSAAYYAAWCTAAEVCRLLQLTGVSNDRGIRIAIHNIIMDDCCADDQHALLKEDFK